MQLPQFPAYPTCTSCKLHSLEGIQHVGIPTIYEPSLPPEPGVPAVVFVGQNPGLEENARGEAFVGSSGIVIRGGWIDPAHPKKRLDPPYPAGSEEVEGIYVDGISLRTRASVYLLNPVRCHHFAEGDPPWKDAAKPCFPYTTIDLAWIARQHTPGPVILVLCGAFAIETIHALLLKGKRLSQSAAFKQNGRTVQADLLGTEYPLTIFSTFHPAAYLRDNNKIHAISSHLRLVSNFLDGTTPAVTEPNLVPPRFPKD